jgi:tRNA pseudouridine38-40 synthase
VRYFFHIGYSGTNYRGWQRQSKTVNIQEVLERGLTQILKIPLSIIGCGRTDAQVHASQFFFHVDIDREWDFDLLFRLNKLLPADIGVFDIIAMKGLPHARFDANKRSYDYFIHTYKDPFLSNVSALYLEKNLDLEKMKEASSLLTRYNDYAAFCKGSSGYEHTICHVTSAQLFADASGDKLRFSISSNRFLSKMIRIIVGKLIDIGKGELSVDEFEEGLITKLPPKTIEPAYPQGLFLSKVTYPYLDLPPRTTFSSILQNKEDSVWVPV